jgi:hypothetical protein
MKGIKLTALQVSKLERVFFNEVSFFNCVQDVNNDWFLFLSSDDIIQINNSEFDFLISLPEFEYVPQVIENPFN